VVVTIIYNATKYILFHENILFECSEVYVVSLLLVSKKIKKRCSEIMISRQDEQRRGHLPNTDLSSINKPAHCPVRVQHESHATPCDSGSYLDIPVRINLHVTE
jgi:hypothetical protein